MASDRLGVMLDSGVPQGRGWVVAGECEGGVWGAGKGHAIDSGCTKPSGAFFNLASTERPHSKRFQV